MKIVKIHYDWYPGGVTSREDFPEEFTVAHVGINGCVLIEEHRAAGEGDKWYYDIHFEDGETIRTFNPNKVFFEKDK